MAHCASIVIRLANVTVERFIAGHSHQQQQQQQQLSTTRTKPAYLIDTVIVIIVADVIEIYGIVWKERLDECNSIHGNVKVAIISSRHKNEPRYIFMLTEAGDRKSQRGQHLRVFV